ncbi:hypothetical protein U1872_08080 [Sphingomonas sp. RB3P16]|uniref:hypothetical protein n=1 Tax=Parasphingomonas frigoris TaxID=3096163 RepID=UPI002FC5B2D5
MSRISKQYGYTGGSQRIVATVDGIRRPIAWGDDITVEELGSFMMCEEFVDIDIEWVDDPAMEARQWPPRYGLQ